MCHFSVVRLVKYLKQILTEVVKYLNYLSL